MYKIIDSKKENNLLSLHIKIDSKLWIEEIDKATNSAIKNISIPGFRKGKIPKDKAKEYINHAVIFDKAANKVLNLIFEKILEEDVVVNDSNVIDANPEVEIKDINNENIEFKFNFDLMPDIEIADYKKIDNVKKPQEITEADIKHQISLLMKKDAEIVSKSIEVVSDHDIAIIDFKGKVDGKELESATAKNYELEIGSKSFIPGFEDSLIGMKKNETKTLNLKFPNEYHAEDLKGKPVEFEVTIKDIKSINYPELTDDYVQKMSQENLEIKAKTVDELKTNIKKQLEKNSVIANKNQNSSKIREYLIEKSKFSYIPQKLVNDQIRRIKNQYLSQLKQYKMELKDILAMQNMTEEKFDEQIKKEAETNVKYSLLVEKIAIKENIQCNESDYEKKFNELIDEYKISDETIKQNTLKQLNDQKDLIETIIIGDKLIDYLIQLNEK
ncbi:trigger factor [Mycoplasmoides pirum]|uniref:trigger factor n=1 Tax=Mycoplasmoides pirum TaxID=2122 RepID=UPI000488450F|nr:trigger factor [Mycoplasmoides pirum]